MPCTCTLFIKVLIVKTALFPAQSACKLSPPCIRTCPRAPWRGRWWWRPPGPGWPGRGWRPAALPRTAARDPALSDLRCGETCRYKHCIGGCCVISIVSYIGYWHTLFLFFIFSGLHVMVRRAQIVSAKMCKRRKCFDAMC